MDIKSTTKIHIQQGSCFAELENGQIVKLRIHGYEDYTPAEARQAIAEKRQMFDNIEAVLDEVERRLKIAEDAG